MSSPRIQDGRGTCKKPKNDDEDRISDLPELVISRILSLMPTKDAVRTSVLSKDWEYKWTSIQRIDIDDTVLYRQHTRDFMGKNETRVIVVNFVERVVRLSRNVKSFCLLLSSHLGYDPDRIAAWISTVSIGNVERLIVDCDYGGVVVLPRSLLLNDSLKYLELHLHCSFKVLARISYPNLRNLNLSRVEIINESSNNDTLALVFPVLETFKLHNCRFLNVKMVEVHAPELTTFHRTFPRSLGQMQADYSIKIISTKLVEFKFSGVPRKFILIGQQVVYAALSYPWPDSIEEVEAIRIHAQSLLKEFSNLKELDISGSLTKAIALSTAGVSCPVLRHLVRLVVFGEKIYAKGLLEFLQATPILKFLKILHLVIYDNYDFDCNAVEPVPPCIKDQLVEFEFGSYCGESSLGFNLVNYLLKNGRALKKVHCLFPRWIE